MSVGADPVSQPAVARGLTLPFIGTLKPQSNGLYSNTVIGRLAID